MVSLETARRNAVLSTLTQMKRQTPFRPDTVRERIIAAGARILASGGREALTTRSVSTAADVQAPTIYRLFGDKDGLLEAVAEDGLTRYIARKKGYAAKAGPLEDLRLGWDLNVEFGLENPAIFSILSASPRAGALSRAASGGIEILRSRMRRVAVAGLLRVSEERAVNLVRVGGSGTVLTLLSLPENERDLGLSVAAREAVIAAITTTRSAVRHTGVAGAAVALRASITQAAPLSAGERALLAELLERLATPVK